MRCSTCDSVLFPNETGEALCPHCALVNAVALGQPAVGSATDSRARGLDGYELIDELGRGAMGVVWLARERALDRLVALKRIEAGANPRLGARLLREGRAVAQLQHPHIVTIYALGEVPGGAFLAMEFLEGGDLQARLKEKMPSPREAATLVAKLADALAHAHAMGVLHRDVKPSNILLDAEGEPHLGDFGLAAPLWGAGDLTAPGQVAGTPAFLAPELLSGTDRASALSDLYGLGALLYVCLTGREPFIGESATVILAQIAEHEPPSPRLLNPAVPRDLEVLCLKCLEKSPAARYGSAEALRDDLGRFLRGEPLLARPVSRAAKVARWCRRKPALAATSALAVSLLLILAIGGPIMAWRMARARAEAETSREAAVASREAALAAEAKTREQLREALLARSRATRLTGARGQRYDALAAVEQAVKIRPGLDARDEAIAALTLPDVRFVREWPLRDSIRHRLSFDPDHDRYTVTHETGAVHVHRLSDATALRVHTGAAPALVGPTFSLDGRWLVVRDAQARSVAWREDKTEPAFLLSERRYALANSVSGYGEPDAFSPDGTLLASAMSQSGVTLHATDDGRELKRIATNSVVTHVAFSPDGRRLAIGCGLATTRHLDGYFLVVHDVESGAELVRPKIVQTYQSLVWSRDGRTLLVGGGPGCELFDSHSGARLRQIQDARFSKAMFGPPGTLVGSSDGGAMILWELATGVPLLTAELGGNPWIALDRTGTRIIKSMMLSGGVFHLEMPAVLRSIRARNPEGWDNVTNHGGSVLEYSRDGRRMVTAVWGAVQLRDAPTGEVVAELPVGTHNNHSSARFADENSLLVASRELGLTRVAIESAESGPRFALRETIDAERDFMLADLSPDGRRALLVSTWRNEAKIVSLDGSTPTVRWKQPGAGRAAFLAGGREVIVNSSDQMGHTPLVVHDAASGAEVRPLAGLTHGYNVRVSHDGRWLLVGTGTGSSALVRLTGTEPAPALPGEVQGTARVAFSHDGESLAVANGSRVALVRLRDGEIVAHLQASKSGSYVPDIAFSPDDAQLSLIFENGTLVQWDLRALRRELAAQGLDW